MGDRPVAVMVTENIVVHRTDEDPRLLAMEDVVAAQANAVIIGRLVENTEKYKENMSQMKETLRKERGEGQELKITHDDSFIDFERLKKAYQVLELDKDALILLVAITKGEKRDLESKFHVPIP